MFLQNRANHASKNARTNYAFISRPCVDQIDTMKSVTTYYIKILSVNTFISCKHAEQITNRQLEICEIAYAKLLTQTVIVS
jgi:ribosomal protein L16/L10AE